MNAPAKGVLPAMILPMASGVPSGAGEFHLPSADQPFIYCSAPDGAAAIINPMFSVCPGPEIHLFVHW